MQQKNKQLKLQKVNITIRDKAESYGILYELKNGFFIFEIFSMASLIFFYIW